MRRWVLAGAASVAFVLASATGAAAHAVMVASEPANGSALAAAPSQVVLPMVEEPDVRFSSIKVLDTGGRAFQRGSLSAPASKTIAVGVGAMPRGVYTVTWRVLSKVDGHVTAGAFAFGIGTSPSA